MQSTKTGDVWSTFPSHLMVGIAGLHFFLYGEATIVEQTDGGIEDKQSLLGLSSTAKISPRYCFTANEGRTVG